MTDKPSGSGIPTLRVMVEDPVDRQSEKSQRFAEAFIASKAIMDGLSNANRTALIKSLCGLYGASVTFAPQFPVVGPYGPIQVADRRISGQQTRAVSQRETVRTTQRPVQRAAVARQPENPAKREFNQRIAALNTRIAAKGREYEGNLLPKDDPLFLERNDLFRWKAQGFPSNRIAED